MTKVSRRISNSAQSESYLSDLWLVITNLKSPEETRGFLTELLTPTEVTMLAKRLRIVKLLLRGESYREIKQQTGAQNVTIANINNQLHTSREGWLARLAKKLTDRGAHLRNRTETKIKDATTPDMPFTFGASRLQ